MGERQPAVIDLDAPVIAPVVDDLRAWVDPLLDADSAELSFEPPPTALPTAETAGVSMHLHALGRRQTFQGSLPPALEAEARFLVTSWAADTVTAAELLTRVLFAAMDRPDLGVELEPPPAEMWQSFGVVPRPSFELRVPLRKERSIAPVPRVRQPLVVHKTALIPMHGVLRATDGTAISGADITLLPSGPTMRTADDGRFTFPAVPAVGTRRLEVRAKGRRLLVAVEPAGPAEPTEPTETPGAPNAPGDSTPTYDITIDLLEG